MGITIADTQMSSDLSPMVAEYRPGACADDTGAWVISGAPPDLPLAGRLLSRNQSITAMVLAEHIAAGRGDDLHAQGWRAELGLVQADGGRP